MKKRQNFLVALVALLGFTAVASARSISVVSASNHEPPVLLDADPCRGVYGLRDPRVDASGAERVYVESSRVDLGDTGFTEFANDHNSYFVNKGGCYGTFGIYLPPWESTLRYPAVPTSAWRTVNVGGVNYTAALNYYREHTIRLPQVWPTKASADAGYKNTDGGLLLRPRYELTCEGLPQAECHIKLPCSAGGVPARNNDSLYDFSGIFVNSGFLPCASSHPTNTGAYTVKRRNMCPATSVTSAIWVSGNASSYYSPNYQPVNVFDAPRCIIRTEFGGAVATHRTIVDYVVGEWKYCTELTAAAAAAAGCDMEARGNPGGDPGGNPGGPGVPPGPGPDDPDPETPVERPGECVANCSSVSDPSPDPAEWSKPHVPLIYDTHCRNYTEAEARAHADSRVPGGQDPSHPEYNKWWSTYITRLNDTECETVLRPKPFAPSWPSGWETYPSMNGYFLLEHLKTHSATGDSQHWGVTDISCATAEENCANHPAVRIMCTEANCGLTEGWTVTGSAGTCQSRWRYQLEDYIVNQFQMWSKWVDGRANPYFPERYESFVWHPEWDGSDPTSRWNNFDPAARQRFAAAGITFENATTGGQGTSQRLDFVGSLWIRGVVEWEGCDGYGRLYTGEEEFVVEVPLEYFFGGWERDSSNNHWAEGPNDWQGSGRERQRYNSTDGITIGGVKKPSIYD